MAFPVSTQEFGKVSVYIDDKIYERLTKRKAELLAQGIKLDVGKFVTRVVDRALDDEEGKDAIQ